LSFYNTVLGAGNIMELKAPEIRGEMSQAVVACKTPLHRQSTPLEVKEAMPTPITPPMML
jgi:hypothetical protein